MALTPEQKEELMRKRAAEYFNDPANFETDLSEAILNDLEGMLKDTHPSTIEKLHMSIMKLIEDNTDYEG
tara:strand:+ start:370 stop:579 length:210 start_codon:yes stop_codon:yes gene_type:complete